MNGADTSWVMVATALVLFMTLPGLALFYGGRVRARNVLSVFMQCYTIACLMSILWFVFGYSIAFGGGTSGVWDGMDKLLLLGVTADDLTGSIPEVAFFAFQMTFATITPALIVGAYVERIGFGFVLLFSGLWMLLVYAPVVHWIWGGGFLADGGIFGAFGVRDFAGGIAVHGVGGVFGTIMIAVFGVGSWAAQLGSLAIVGLFTFVLTLALVKLVALVTPLRVDAETEVNGLDLSVHGVRAYDLHS